MSMKSRILLLGALAMIAGCTQFDAWTGAQRGKPAAEQGATKNADEIYINTNAAAAGQYLRNVYIAPVNLANMQVIQPEGAAADREWWVTDTEDTILQQAIVGEFAAALGYGSAFNIVSSRAEAEIIVEAAVVAIHPNETRSSRDITSGAITVSIAVVNAASNDVLVRVVDTRPGEDIWAFNRVVQDDPVRNQIFRAWGDSIRQGMMQLQGRPNEARAPAVALNPK